MKFKVVLFLLLLNAECFAQEWFAEVMLGTSSYNGDLTEREISAKRLQPAINVNLKYNTGHFLNFRGGLTYSKLGADDKDNPDKGLQSRNLNFKTSIWELSVGAELIFLDPDTYYSYPYVFAGVGAFRFNPYTYDINKQKQFLRPLGTEGQGLAEFPNRKKYALTEICFPLGGGFKIKLKEDYELCFEIGYRLLFTDYLDDVSKTYPNLQSLETQNGAKAAELSYRKIDTPFTEENEKRGNSVVRDSYFFSGIKIAKRLGW